MDKSGVIFWAVVLVIGLIVWAIFGDTGVTIMIISGVIMVVVLVGVVPLIAEISESQNAVARQERAEDKLKLMALFAEVKELWGTGDKQLAAEQVQALILSSLPALHGEGKAKVIEYLLRLRTGGPYRSAGVLNKDAVMIELAQADLRGLNLRGDYALSEADLHDVDLSGAYLINVFLNEADLHGANLQGAKLIRVGFNEADLTGADLSGASLYHSHLFGTDFSGANLHGADFRETLGLEQANLRGAVFDENTQWPEGYEPIKHGAVQG